MFLQPTTAGNHDYLTQINFERGAAVHAQLDQLRNGTNDVDVESNALHERAGRRGPCAHLEHSMAIAVIGGLLLSTILSLLFVPALFSLIHGAEGRLSGWVSRRIGLNRPRHPAE